MGKYTCYLCKRTSSKTENISLHRFPKDLTTRQKWLHVCKLSLNDDVSHIYVCSMHFVKADIRCTFGISKIQPTAVPSMTVTNSLTNIEKKGEENVDDLSDVPSNMIMNNNYENEVEGNSKAPNDNIYNTPKKQRKFFEPRYISEITKADFSTPRRSDRVLKLIKATDEKKSIRIKKLQDERRRLKKRIKSLEDLVSYLKNKKMISEENHL